jgi:hypothetical protein
MKNVSVFPDVGFFEKFQDNYQTYKSFFDDGVVLAVEKNQYWRGDNNIVLYQISS